MDFSNDRTRRIDSPFAAGEAKEPVGIPAETKELPDSLKRIYPFSWILVALFGVGVIALLVLNHLEANIYAKDRAYLQQNFKQSLKSLQDANAALAQAKHDTEIRHDEDRWIATHQGQPSRVAAKSAPKTKKRR